MSRFIALLLTCTLLSSTAMRAGAVEPLPTIPPSAGNPAVYGQYPLAYKEIITRWLGTVLADPASAVVDWGDAPKAGEYKTQKGQRYTGYVVDFKVSARNRFGGSTGKQKYRVVIRNADVLWAGRPRY